MQFDQKYFKGKVAVVTGGASGIGLAFVEELLQSKADKVILADFNEKNLTLHEKQLSEHYPDKVKGILCDVTQESEVERMVQEACVFGNGRLDLVINCAGADFTLKFTEEPDGIDPNNHFLRQVATNKDWEKAFALNFFGALYVCRHTLPIMLEQGAGQIVNIISGAAFTPMAYQSMYSASKAALNALTLSLRAEYARYNIKFNSATPGTTTTAIFDNIGGAPPEAQTPHDSAVRMLVGIANNDRLILGDDSDVDGAEHCFIPEPYAKITDRIYRGFSKARKKGELSYVPDEVSLEVQREMTSSEREELRLMVETFGDMSDKDVSLENLRAYLAQKDADTIPEGSFAGKTAVVTGAASGIGLGLCEVLLQCGASRVVLADRNKENLDEQRARLDKRYPGKVKSFACDVSCENEVSALIAFATEFFEGKFDLLINNAGIGQSGLFAEVPDNDQAARAHLFVEPQERWDQVLAVNFYGPLYGCRAVLPVMLKQGSGQIINVISGTAFSGMPYQSLYASSKAALNMLTLSLRYEYWDEGIIFNSATPGTTATAIFGEGDVPLNAQTPQHSALRILAGAARNERLIFGDDLDAETAIMWGNAIAAPFLDKYYAATALSRFLDKPVSYNT